MKSPMTQIMMIALAILFATALSLTIALICISYVQEEGKNIPPASETSGSLSSREPFSELPATASLPELPSLTEPVTQQPPEPEPLGNGLSYLSNGNGTCSLTGIGTCEDTFIVIPEYSPSGERVVAIADRAFYGCSSVTAVQIPSAVTYIGNLAFAACRNLIYISVNERNAFFCDIDGILYTIDGSELLLYPPMRAGSSVTISTVTKRIDEMAFYSCAYLTTVYYAGSPAEWENIRIGVKNYSLTAAAKFFSKEEP